MFKQGPEDTTVKLWEYYYKVKIPYLASRKIDDIKSTGVVISGISSYDRDIENQQMTTMLSIAQMVDYYKEHVPIRVCNQADVKQIYEHISEHIHAWKSRLERGINIGDAPVDDLILLDRFANTVYEHAKYQFTPEMAQSIFASHLGNIQRVNANNFFSKAATKTNEGKEDGIVRINGDDTPDRDSLGEFFKTRLINLRRQ